MPTQHMLIRSMCSLGAAKQYTLYNDYISFICLYIAETFSMLCILYKETTNHIHGI